MIDDNRTTWQRTVDKKLEEIDGRLTEWEKEQAVYKALAEEQRRQMNDRFNRVQDNITNTRTDLTTQVSAIKSGINRVLWTVGAAVTLAFVEFVIRGGFKSPL